MNEVILTGRIVRELEVNRTQAGKAVCTFSLAVDNYHKGEADFPKCVAWGALAENMEKFCYKGQRIGVRGNLTTRNYEDKKNVKHFITEVNCLEVEYLEKKNKSVFDENKESAPDFPVIDGSDSALPF